MDVKYVEGSSLGGWALFVGFHIDAVALPAAEFPKLNPNSIYFTDSQQDSMIENFPTGGHDIDIFNYENKTVLPSISTPTLITSPTVTPPAGGGDPELAPKDRRVPLPLPLCVYRIPTHRRPLPPVLLPPSMPTHRCASHAPLPAAVHFHQPIVPTRSRPPPHSLSIRKPTTFRNARRP
ncbi:Unknown protein [Striga hermonthica]|uniref:KIB1-4 beta-propeller domain-containing protein n=1 Tax=Striga hermonthica TaxID=68872 RepID=A0A9N7RFV1_STRHE|nr:Unknown protein [Striga hermonthica]